MADSEGKPKLFVRGATGLVREIGFSDQFLTALAIMNPLIGFILTVAYAPYFFPGAYLPLVFVIGLVPTLAQALIYSIFSGAMPRSGGDYVWSSRIMGPLFATVQMIFIFAVILLLGATFATYSSVTIVLSQLFLSLGITTSSSNLTQIANSFGQAPIGFPIDIAIMIVCAVVLVTGLRTWVWFQRVGSVLVYALAAVMIVALLTLDHSSVPRMFDNAMKVAGSNATYSGVIQSASAGGFKAGFNWTDTLLASIPWGFLTYSGFQFGTYLAGETKNAKSSFYRALLLSVFATALIIVIMSLLVYDRFGLDFINSASYVASTGSSLPTLPTASFLLSLTNPGLALFIGVGVFLSVVLTTLVDIIGFSRMLFAASFDRLLPARLANVSERFHTPHWSILTCSVVYVLWFAILWYAGFISSILNASLVVPVGYGMPLVAALLFYFKRRDLFDRTVGQVSRVSVVIIASLIGIGAFAFYGFAEAVPISSGLYLGASLGLAFEVLVGFADLGIAIYAVARLKTRAVGIDLRSIYEEIPPE